MTMHINLALVFHQHQPVGNYGFVFEDLYRQSYEPLVACIERHPGVKVGLHYSGPLLDWLTGNRPDYIARIAALVARGQVEMLGGGYYEPALPAISEADRIGQLKKLHRKVEELFGRAPTGAWVAERVWEPELPTSLAAAGYRWTILDDVHFEGAGVPPDQISGWYLTEAQGETIGVFASNTQFRYLVPWGSIEGCIDFLRSRGDRRPGSLVAMGDDGEKFGGWPTTYLHCWENGWVEGFFARLEAESHWIGTVHLGDWRETEPADGLAYLPSTSYMEMGEWSLPPEQRHKLERAKAILRQNGGDELVPFVSGGHWRNFLVRYPEVNLLQKRALILSREAHRQGTAAAIDHVWQAQCNCPFWHGVFGGVYLENIRNANFGHLAAADEALFPGSQPPDVRDWDVDGHDEVCLRSNDQLVVVDPNSGGEILHWDLRHRGWHLTHAVARRPEAYHEGLSHLDAGDVRNIHDGIQVKDPAALDSVFHYDRGLRVAAQDSVLWPSATREEYRRERQARVGHAASWRAFDQEISLTLEGAFAPYTKRIQLGAGLVATYHVAEPARLFSEWNLSLPDGPAGEPPEFSFSTGSVRVATAEFCLTAEHNAADAWVEQLFSASNTEGGVELAPQGWCIVFAAELDPAANDELQVAWSTNA
ncbi:MAG TPA: alpha-amylase/4-alpha-glucanotransferase domain-containing protein [Tepidiformaceae bacterium]|nr:alpha-amylase/4-alpha-glucanotransferase domain-containing protein [Tepidiformaceae bacterium]